MATQELDIYYHRWQGLDTLLTGLIESYGKQDFPRKNTILYLLKSLQAFANGQFQFFFFGLQHKHPERLPSDPRLQVDPEFPTEDILTGILEQIGHDIELIRRAADQRILGSETERTALAWADKLAWIAIKPAIDYAAVEEATTVLTYFEKAAKLYRIPYAQVAMIAVPVTCAAAEDPRDFLAIPHEMGHYVYRHPVGSAQDKLAEVRAIFDVSLNQDETKGQYLGFVKAIFEETFADIYGCLIGGPVMALDFQDLCLAKSITDMRDGDGTHANPAIRPLIYCMVLKNERVRQLISEASKGSWTWEPIADKLIALWNERIAARGIKDFSFKTSQTKNKGKVNETTIVGKVTTPLGAAFSDRYAPGLIGDRSILALVIEDIVDTILAKILAYGEENRPKHNALILQGWAGKTDRKTDPAKLYEMFKGNLIPLVNGVKIMPPEADPSSVASADRASGAHSSPLWIDWVKVTSKELLHGGWPPEGTIAVESVREPGEREIAVGSAMVPGLLEIEAGDVKEPGEREIGKWGYILFAGGWTTDGPSGDVGHPQI